MKKENNGFSLIELVIVIFILLILIVFGLPGFLQFLEVARFRITGLSLVESYKKCRVSPESTPLIPLIEKVSFTAGTCNDSMAATINEKCTLEIDLVSGEKKGWPNSYKECLPSKNINLNTEVEAKKTNSQEKEEEPRIILPRDANGDILFSGFSVLSPTAKLDCQSDLGKVDSIKNEGKEWYEQPGILLSKSNSYSKTRWPNGKSYLSRRPDCLGVEVPASAFVDGKLPKPFEVKEAYMLKGSGYEKNRPYKINVFDETGRPLMLISPDEHEVDQEAWEKYLSDWGDPYRDPTDRKSLMENIRALNPEFDWSKVTEGVK